MYSAVHSSAGLFIARAIPNPILGIAAAIASHYLLDAIPHGDTGFGDWMMSQNASQRIAVVSMIDLGSAALMVSYLVATHPGQAAWYLIAGAIGGILPDLLWGLRFIVDKVHPLPITSPLLHWHDRLHSWGHAKASYDMSFRAGLLYQGALLGLILGLRL